MGQFALPTLLEYWALMISTPPGRIGKWDAALESGCFVPSARGSVRLYSSDLAEVFERYGRAVGMTASALASKRLLPFYQPKVQLADGKRQGFEALARILTHDGSPLRKNFPGQASVRRRTWRNEQMPTPQDLEARFWKALKSDMTMMRGGGHAQPAADSTVGRRASADGETNYDVLRRRAVLTLRDSMWRT